MRGNNNAKRPGWPARPSSPVPACSATATGRSTRPPTTSIRWANTWQPTIGALPDTLDRLARLATGTDHPDRLHDALAAHAQRLAAHAHPERGDAEQAVTRADAAHERAQTAYEQAAQPYTAGLGRYASSRVLRRAIQNVRDLQPRVAGRPHRP